MSAYTVILNHWVDGSGWSHSETFDHIPEACTAEEYVRSLDTRLDPPTGCDDIFVQICEGESCISEVWVSDVYQEDAELEASDVMEKLKSQPAKVFSSVNEKWEIRPCTAIAYTFNGDESERVPALYACTFAECGEETAYIIFNWPMPETQEEFENMYMHDVFCEDWEQVHFDNDGGDIDHHLKLPS